MIAEIGDGEEPTTMADELRMGLQELLRKAELDQDADFLRDGVRVLAQALMELEVGQHLGAAATSRSRAWPCWPPTRRRCPPAPCWGISPPNCYLPQSPSRTPHPGT
ncbi:MAG: hypothetical protein HY718_05005 [Planctomycetes bacterium]|nr:hypothetical protein [Planctomycetota bacterium]